MQTTPAMNVKGSPMTGSQANNKDHLPYLVNQKEAFWSWLAEKENHHFVSKFLVYFPNTQLKDEPRTLPKLATIKSGIFSSEVALSPANTTSEEKGRIVAAKNAIEKRVK